MAISIPVVQTERLILRAHRVTDFAEFAAMWANEHVTRYTIGKPATHEESWSRLLRDAGHWAVLGFGFWAVEEKASGKYAGEVGFLDLRRNIQPSLADMPEIGWILAPEFHGKGYATEAARAALVWGDENLKCSRTSCIVQPENTASLRVAKKVGYGAPVSTTYKDQAVVILFR
jgi:RimJ/RimL family protein N-acetyltransferase